MSKAVFACVLSSLLCPAPLHTELWYEPRWTEADCTAQKEAQHRDSPNGFTVDDPHFLPKYQRWFRLLTECKP